MTTRICQLHLLVFAVATYDLLGIGWVSCSQCHVTPEDKGLSEDCSNMGLSSIPRDLVRTDVVRLLLNDNNITTINNNDFQNFTQLLFLNLSNNPISNINPAAFQSIPQLQHLLLKYLQLTGWPDKALEPLANLTHLELGQSIKYSNQLGPPGPGFYNLVNLEKLDLSVLHFSSISAVFFSNIRKGKLRYVDLASVVTGGFSAGAFRGFNVLEYLDLTDIRLDHNDLQRIMSDLNGSALEVLNLSGTRSLDLLDENTFSEFQHNSLKEIILSYSYDLQSISDDTFVNLKALKKLSVDNCYIQNVTSKTCSGLDNLEFLDISGNRLMEYDFSGKTLPRLLTLNISSNRHLRTMQANGFSGLHTLQHLEAYELRLEESLEPCAFCGLGNLRMMRCNFLTAVNISVSSFHGLYNLTDLDIMSIGLTFLHATVFQDMQSLVNLNVDGNALMHITKDAFVHVAGTLKSLSMDDCSLSKDHGMFLVLNQLQMLSLRKNNMTISPVMFGSNNSIQSLTVSYNKKLDTIADAFKSLRNLRHLDVSFCSISMISEKSDFDFLNSPTLEEFAASGNPYTCSCKMEHFAKWINATEKLADDPRLYQCNSSENLVHHMHVLKKQCDMLAKLPLFIAIPCGIVGVALIHVLVLYRYRHRLKDWYWKKIWVKHYQTLTDSEVEEDDPNVIYDAFVACSSNDQVFVNKYFIPNLERAEGEENFKLFIEFREFPPGAVTHEATIEYINKSRKVLMLLSNSYIKSGWHLIHFDEANESADRTKIIIIILEPLDEISMRNLPQSLVKLLKERIYSQWTDNKEGQNYFWQRLRLALQQSPRTPSV